jgi:hypothetical protein
MTQLQLSNQMRLQISAASATLHPSIRESFVRGIMRALSAGSRAPNMNDVLMCIKQGLSFVETKKVLISPSTSTVGEYDDYRYRKARL